MLVLRRQEGAFVPSPTSAGRDAQPSARRGSVLQHLQLANVGDHQAVRRPVIATFHLPVAPQ